MKQKSNTDFLLDVFERFGKSDAQAALDFVRRNKPLLNHDEEKAAQLQENTIQPVDLGLPSGTLWADRNLGSKSVEDYGAYVSWGNTDLRFPKEFDDEWGDNDKAFDCIEDFDYDEYQKTPGAKLTENIDAKHDAATVNLGDSWHMPTREQFNELYDNCDWIRKTINGVNGYLVISKINGNSIFFPAAGSGYGSSLDDRGTLGLYWSSSLYSADSGYNLYFNSSSVYPQDNSYRYGGFSVRAVQYSQNK